MKKYFDSIISPTGRPVSNATVSVYNYGTTTLATLYGDSAGGSATSNPITTDSNGAFSFYAADGRYSISIEATGYTTQSVTDILLDDPANANAISATTLTATTAITLAGRNVASYSVDGSGNVTGLVGPGSYLLGSAGFVPATNDYAGILAAYNAAVAAGGGVVQLLAVTYTLGGNTLPISSGIKYIGVTPVLSYTTALIPDAFDVALGSATIFQGDGTQPAFKYNSVALGTPASQNAFSRQAVTNCMIANIGFNNFSHAILAGNTNAASFWYSEFSNLYITGGTQWGLSITNFQHCDFRRIYTFGCVNGQYYGNDVPAAILMPGNSSWYDIYSVTRSGTYNGKDRALVFKTIQGGQNEGFLCRIQSNRFGASFVTQAATATAASTSIVVTDGTKFAVDMPVSFSATANGFTTKQIYFVASVAGNTLTLSNTQGGAAITATGATAFNIISSGFPCLEVVALAGANHTAHVFDNLDVEGGGECAILLQNASGNSIRISQTTGPSQSTQGICLRGAGYNEITAFAGASTDFDSGSATSSFYGLRNVGCVQYLGMGIYQDATTSNRVLGLGSAGKTQDKGDLSVILGSFLYPNTGMGIRSQTFGGTSVTLNESHTGAVTLNGTGNFTFTLPTISASNVGIQYNISNQYTATTITLNTNGTQLFNGKAALTSLSILTQGSVTVAAVSGGGNFYWSIIGIGGTYSAGTITGL
jgi:hypothetical protein